jgi:hypothetical protein
MPEALELCGNLKDRHISDLSDDEILMLAFTAAQAALLKHVEPGNHDAEETLNTILSVLDHDTIVQAEMRKLHALRLWSLKHISSKQLRDSAPAPRKPKRSA